MKETELHLQDTVAIVDEKQVIKKERFLGTAKLYPGHTHYQYNYETNELSAVVYDVSTVGFGDGTKRHKVITKPNCIYFGCLNIRSATKYIRKVFQNDTIKPVIL
jgi:hypothetical protein